MSYLGAASTYRYDYDSSEEGSITEPRIFVGNRNIGRTVGCGREWAIEKRTIGGTTVPSTTESHIRVDSWNDEEVPSCPPQTMVSKKWPSSLSQIQFDSSGDSNCADTEYHVHRRRKRCSRTMFLLLLIVTCFMAGFFFGGVIWFARMERFPQVPGISDSETDQDVTNDDLSTPVEFPTGPRVGAYYYPWYANDFHRQDGYLRDQLSPPQRPSLGEYDDRDPATISQHLSWSRQANIDLWVSSWWGPGSREDETLREVILKHPELDTHRIAIFYETTGRIKASEGYTTQRVRPDLEYLCSAYFDHPNYLRIDNKPVLFVYLTRKLETNGNLPLTMDEMRKAAASAGCGEIYLVGDHVFQGSPETEDVYPPFNILDAVTNYDVYGSMGGQGGYANRQGVVDFYREQGQWRTLAKEQGCDFLPSASPGYNDLGVRPGRMHRPLSRRLSPEDHEGSLFEVALQQARTLVDSAADHLLIINSFNEWHEDVSLSWVVCVSSTFCSILYFIVKVPLQLTLLPTLLLQTQIEPTVGESTELPQELTYGLSYEGYGEQYLDILQRETS